jgi:hypothetical protein
MDMGSLARSMRARMLWPVGQRVLRQNDLPRGQGWGNTVDRLSGKGVDYEDKADLLAEDLKKHLLCGEKLVRFYGVRKQAKDHMIAALRRAKPKHSPFREAYPCLVPQDELDARLTAPVLVAVEESDEGLAAVFGSVRTILVREPLDREELPKDAIDALADYDEIVGIKHVRHEAIDVVEIPSNGSHVNVRIDYPNGMHRDVGQAAQSRINDDFARLIDADHLTSPINLFPLIDEMYKARREGSVVELAFGTTTASLKHERMRRRASCLRDEAYHKGGKAALRNPIEPYRLSIVWSLPLDHDGFSAPELGLYSSSIVAS